MPWGPGPLAFVPARYLMDVAGQLELTRVEVGLARLGPWRSLSKS